MIKITITGLVGHIGIGKQADFVSESAVNSYTPTLTHFFVVTEESFTAENTPLTTDNEIGRGRDRTGGIAPGYAITGGFGGYARVEDLGKLCEMALSSETPNTSTPGINIITPSNYLAWYSIEKNVGDTLYLWIINAKVNSLTISVNKEEIATYTADFVATIEKKISEADAEVPSYSSDVPLAFHGGLIKIGGSQYNNMESIEIAINNNLSTDEYTVRPSRFLNNVTEGSRTIDLNFNQVFTSVDDYTKYTYGNPARTTPGYELFETNVQFVLMNAQSQGSATQWIQFDFPRVMFGSLPVTLTSGRIVVANTGLVLAPASGDIMTVTYK